MEAMIFCPKCGVKNLVSASVCISCGKPLAAAIEAESKYVKRPLWKTAVGYLTLVPMIVRLSEQKYWSAALCVIISLLAFMPRLKRQPQEK